MDTLLVDTNRKWMSKKTEKPRHCAQQYRNEATEVRSD